MDLVRTYQFASGMVFLLLAGSFTFGDAGVHWMWQNTPVVGAVLAAVSCYFWSLLVLKARRRRRRVER